MAEMSGAEAVVESLVRAGVEVVFALPGQQLDALFNAFHNARDKIRLIHPRHEQATVYMANGYALATGRLGVACVVPGPGLLNASAALATGFSQNAPVLCITGQIPSHLIGKGTGQLHEIRNQLGAVAGFTKYQATIEKPRQAPEKVARAISIAAEPRTQPVVVEIAPDVLQAKDTVDFGGFRLPDPYDGGVDGARIGAIADALAAAKFPLIFAGSGAVGAASALTALAETLGAPVLMSQYGLGAVDYRNPLAHSLISGAALWPKVDVVLAVGTRFSLPRTWGIEDVTVLRIDADRGYADATIGAAETVLPALAGALNGARLVNAWDPAELVRAKADAEARMAAEMGLSDAYTRAIRAGIPDDGFVCFDITQLGYHAWWGYPTYGPRTNIRSGYMGTLGFAFPTSLGAKVAVPDKPVVCVTGDGGFMFGIQELATAVQHKINLVVIVMNDGGYGNVRRYHDELYDGARIATELPGPSYADVGRLFGWDASSAVSPDELTRALGRAIGLDAPALIEVTVGALPSWQGFIPRRRLRGAKP